MLVLLLEPNRLFSDLFKEVVRLVLVPARTTSPTLAIGVLVIVPRPLLVLLENRSISERMAIVTLVRASTPAFASSTAVAAIEVVTFSFSGWAVLLRIGVTHPTSSASPTGLSVIPMGIEIRIMLSIVRFRTVTHSMAFFLTPEAPHGGPYMLSSPLSLIIVPAIRLVRSIGVGLIFGLVKSLSISFVDFLNCAHRN